MPRPKMIVSPSRPAMALLPPPDAIEVIYAPKWTKRRMSIGVVAYGKDSKGRAIQVWKRTPKGLVYKGIARTNDEEARMLGTM